jgi:hypothetical protein
VDKVGDWREAGLLITPNARVLLLGLLKVCDQQVQQATLQSVNARSTATQC